jgi:hypothetical protein
VGFYGFDGSERDKEFDEEQPAGKDWWGENSANVENEILRAEELGVRTVVVRTGILLDMREGALGGQLPCYRKGQINLCAARRPSVCACGGGAAQPAGRKRASLILTFSSLSPKIFSVLTFSVLSK